MSESASPIDLFLSHNSADKPWVRSLAERIESETLDGTPSSRHLRVFLDEWDIDVGENIIERINDGLARARHVAVVVSPDLLRAPFPTLEWTHIVVDDPANRKGRLIPLFLRDWCPETKVRVDLPAPFKALKWLDFRRQRDFKRSYQRLVRRVRGLPPKRGTRRRPLASLPSPATPIAYPEPETASSPDRIREALLANLLPVESYPGIIWSAGTDARAPKDVFEVVSEPPAFELQQRRLYTFDDMSAPASVLREVTRSSGMTRDSVADWRDAPPRMRWFVSLLNRCLRNHLGKLPIRRDERGRYFFLPNRDGTPRKWKNARDPAREVAAKKASSVPGRDFWVHHGAWLSFLTLGDQLYLSIEPSYVFTSDGRIPLGGIKVTSLAMAWGGKERNAALLRHVVFWARTLSKGKAKIELATGSQPIIVSGIPAVARTSVGIEFDHIEFRSLLAQIADELGDVAASVELSNEPARPHEGSGDGHGEA